MKNMVPAAAVLLLTAACDLSDPLGLGRLSFTLGGTDDFTVCGIVLDSLDSLDPLQVLDVVEMWSQGEAPVDLVLDIGIRNPNTGAAGLVLTAATIVSMPWDLYMDATDDEGFDSTWVASGVLLDPFEVPGDSSTVYLPLDVSFDAFAVLSLLDPLDFIELMLAVGGIDGDLRDEDHLGRLLLRIEPSVDTPFGPIDYPDPVWVWLDWSD